MSTTQPTKLSPRAQAWYDSLMEQLETIEERMPANILKVKRTIGLYERVYGMSSDEMLRKLAENEIEETNDICSWAQEVALLERILAEHG
jgi:hypothetical protein